MNNQTNLIKIAMTNDAQYLCKNTRESARALTQVMKALKVNVKAPSKKDQLGQWTPILVAKHLISQKPRKRVFNVIKKGDQQIAVAV